MIVDIKSEILRILPSKNNNRKVELIIKPVGQLEKLKCTIIDEKITRRLHLYKVSDIVRVAFKIEARPYGQTNSWTNHITILELM